MTKKFIKLSVRRVEAIDHLIQGILYPGAQPVDDQILIREQSGWWELMPFYDLLAPDVGLLKLVTPGELRLSRKAG